MTASIENFSEALILSGLNISLKKRYGYRSSSSFGMNCTRIVPLPTQEPYNRHYASAALFCILTCIDSGSR